MTDQDRLTAIRARQRRVLVLAKQLESAGDERCLSDLDLAEVLYEAQQLLLVCSGHEAEYAAQLATVAAERADCQGALMDAGVSVGPHLPDAVRALTDERDALQQQVEQMAEELRQWRARSEELEQLLLRIPGDILDREK